MSAESSFLEASSVRSHDLDCHNLDTVDLFLTKLGEQVEEKQVKIPCVVGVSSLHRICSFYS